MASPNPNNFAGHTFLGRNVGRNLGRNVGRNVGRTSVRKNEQNPQKEKANTTLKEQKEPTLKIHNEAENALK